MADLYLVSRTDRCGYDEYDEVLVAADSPEDAIDFVTQRGSGGWARFEGMYTTNTKAEKIENYRRGDIIISSFRAG